MNAQNTKKWAIPGTGRRNSLRWPKTSVISALTWAQTSFMRSGAGLPVETSRNKNRLRRRTNASPMTVIASPNAILTATKILRVASVRPQPVPAGSLRPCQDGKP